MSHRPTPTVRGWLVEPCLRPEHRRHPQWFERNLADGLALLYSVYQPEVTILSGSGAVYLPHYETRSVKSYAYGRRSLETCPVVPGRLGPSAWAIGGSVLVANL